MEIDLSRPQLMEPLEFAVEVKHRDGGFTHISKAVDTQCMDYGYRIRTKTRIYVIPWDAIQYTQEDL